MVPEVKVHIVCSLFQPDPERNVSNAYSAAFVSDLQLSRSEAECIRCSLFYVSSIDVALTIHLEKKKGFIMKLFIFLAMIFACYALSEDVLLSFWIHSHLNKDRLL
ncbi:hemocyanin-like 1 (Hcl-1) [Biomphalaria pfeifferi]|uniref:Hemocyanin-like 1 (Hcl-1) n=1 Tax=Biomphalaria pfeifferi TaxID=112525 RepID=A0AAD8FKM4_BIOPF|nr:hemocyanin-like 1 (Hcl-1) [Biomphalaria pfeifferi]